MSDVICKHCGMQFGNLKSLTSNFCSKSPTKKHEVFEGGIQKEYI